MRQREVPAGLTAQPEKLIMGDGLGVAVTTQALAQAPEATGRRFTLSAALTWLIFAAFAAYAAAYIYHTSFLAHGVRAFCLFDDGMISMRYAKNLAHGYGLVWNPGGERVEGFTNPLWVAYMALWHLLPISPVKLSLPIQISSAACLFAALFFVRRMGLDLSHGSPWVALAAMVLSGFYLPVINWGLQGMEVGALVLLLAAAASVALRRLSADTFSLLPYLLLGIAMLVRFDAFVLILAMTAFGLAWDRPHWKQHLLAGLGTLVLFGLSQTLFRLWYFGEPFPNTYYLKMTGYPMAFRLLRGALAYLHFASALPWWLLPAALIPLFVKRTRGYFLLLALFLAQSAYSIYVGGDAWEWWGGSNRYLCVIMPLFFTLVALGLAPLWEWVVGPAGEPRRKMLASLLAVAFVVAGLVMSNSSGPSMREEWLLRTFPLHRDRNEINLETSRLLREVTTEKALISVDWAGSIPYFCERTCHDCLGKCDRRIAHETVHLIMDSAMAEGFIPGHLKYDFDYTVRQLQPDLMLRDVSRGRRQKQFFKSRYRSFLLGDAEVYVKLGSPNIRWDSLYREDAAAKRRRGWDRK